jgi:hypothetical protein
MNAENRDTPDDDASRHKDTKRQIRRMMNEFAANCDKSRARDEVFWDLLDTCVASLAAHGGVVWAPVFGMPSLFQCGIGKGRELKAESVDALRERYIEPFIAFVASERTPMKAPPGESGGCPGSMNPTDHLWLFAPIDDSRGKTMPFAVLQIVQRSGTPETTQAAYLRFMQQMCDVAVDGLRRAR